MLETLKKLEIVQELDLQIQGLQKKKSDFPVKLAAFDAEMKTLQLKIEDKKKTTNELERQIRQSKGALEMNEERSKRSNEKLGSVKTSYELSSAQKEIDSLKKNNEVVTGAVKKLEDELAAQAAEIATIEAKIAEIKATRDSEAGKIEGEEKVIDTDLGALNGKRKEATVGVEARVLANYDRIRIGKGGVALAYAMSGQCNGCYVKLPPQFFNELQRGVSEIYACQNCKRILIYKVAQKV